jgi:peptide/nickel transport system permease protein
MAVFILRRLLEAVVVMLTVALLAFCLFNFVGDPTNAMIGTEGTQQQREVLRKQLGLDDPAPIQFVRFVGRAMQGEFGISYRNAVPVSRLIAERLPATLELVFCASLLALALGISLGVYTGLAPRSMLSRLVQAISLVGVSLPSFVVGILLILVFSVTLGVLPSYGRGETIRLGWWTSGLFTASGLKALILPSITLGTFQLALILRLVRAEVMEVMRTDYIKFARARGLPARVIYFKHALMAALIPVVTVVGLQIGSLIAFAIVTETVFQWPGMGFLFIQAVNFGDMPVIAAYLVLTAFIFVVINLVVDLLYVVIDPRLSVTTGESGR